MHIVTEDLLGFASTTFFKLYWDIWKEKKYLVKGAKMPCDGRGQRRGASLGWADKKASNLNNHPLHHTSVTSHWTHNMSALRQMGSSSRTPHQFKVGGCYGVVFSCATLLSPLIPADHHANVTAYLRIVVDHDLCDRSVPISWCPRSVGQQVRPQSLYNLALVSCT